MQLSADDRKVRISRARNYTEKIFDDGGNRSETKRHETLTKEFSVPEIVDATKIERNYEDGYIVFVIKKK